MSVVSADLVVIVITWRRTYRLWREASRQGEPSRLMSLVLRDGESRDISLVSSQLNTHPYSRYFVFCVSCVSFVQRSTFSDLEFVSVMLILNILELAVMRAWVTESSVCPFLTGVSGLLDHRCVGKCCIHFVYPRPVCPFTNTNITPNSDHMLDHCVVFRPSSSTTSSLVSVSSRTLIRTADSPTWSQHQQPPMIHHLRLWDVISRLVYTLLLPLLLGKKVPKVDGMGPNVVWKTSK